LITFIGSIPGIFSAVTIYLDVSCCSCSGRPASAFEIIEVQREDISDRALVPMQLRFSSVFVPENPRG
jgi:hypothetical protein